MTLLQKNACNSSGWEKERMAKKKVEHQSTDNQTVASTDSITMKGKIWGVDHLIGDARPPKFQKQREGFSQVLENMHTMVTIKARVEG